MTATFDAPSYAFRTSVNVAALFETPIVVAKLDGGDNLMADLEAAIRARKSADAGVARSNIGGWHSATDMLDWGGAAAAKLAETAVKIAKRMTTFAELGVEDYDWPVRMWANVSPAGALNHLHLHPGNIWAAVLYLDMGGRDAAVGDGGAFYLEDPRFPLTAMRLPGLRMRGGDGQPQQHQVELQLTRGDLLVFPAWLRHGVRPYTGQRERITIAMNIDAREKRPEDRSQTV